MSTPWSVEFWRITAVALVALLIGLLIDRLLLCLFLAVIGYLAWFIYHLYRLERWLRFSGKMQPLVETGLLGEIYHHVYRLRQRHHRRKRRLSEALERFQKSAAAMPDATVALRASGEIEWFNDAAKRLLGLSRSQDIGHRIVNLLRHPDFVEFYERGDYADNVEFPSPLDEQIILSLRIVPYGDEQKLLVARDVTQLHRLEGMRRDFVANVSHELRTPLTVISGYLETLAGAGDDCSRQWWRSLELMSQHTTRMQHLVEDLLLLSRLETETPSEEQGVVAVPVLLNYIREDAVSLSADKRHTIDLEADPDLYLRGNEKELRSVFSNLVTNAVQYTPEKGMIRIRWYADNSGGHYQVSDTGIGIPAKHVPRLTERFYRVDVGRSRREGGTGLGLAIVKHVLQRHNASLRIESEVGKGSIFTCDFPADSIIRKNKEVLN